MSDIYLYTVLASIVLWLVSPEKEFEAVEKKIGGIFPKNTPSQLIKLISLVIVAFLFSLIGDKIILPIDDKEAVLTGLSLMGIIKSGIRIYTVKENPNG